MGLSGINGGATVPRRWVDTVEARPKLDAAVLAREGLLGNVPAGIEAIAVPATLGGEFWLLRCPQCRRRFQALYELDGAFKCRACHRLDYRSRHQDHNNPLQKLARLRRQIGAHPSMIVPLPPRPRDRAARAIYDKLASEIAIAELRVLSYLRGMSTGLEKYAERRNERKRRSNSERSEPTGL